MLALQIALKEDCMSTILGPRKKTISQPNIKCYYLVWFERYQYVNHAIEREKEIKGWLRAKKEKLIESENPDCRFLNTEIMEWPPKRDI